MTEHSSLLLLVLPFRAWSGHTYSLCELGCGGILSQNDLNLLLLVDVYDFIVLKCRCLCFLLCDRSRRCLVISCRYACRQVLLHNYRVFLQHNRTFPTLVKPECFFSFFISMKENAVSSDTARLSPILLWLPSFCRLVYMFWINSSTWTPLCLFNLKLSNGLPPVSSFTVRHNWSHNFCADAENSMFLFNSTSLCRSIATPAM